MSRTQPNDDLPLGMTVHSMPQPASDAQAAVRTRSGRWKMLLVLLVCAAPVLASYYAYYVVRPEGRRVFGTLVEPQRPLPDLVASTLDGKPVHLQSLRGQWLLISVADAACDPDCAQRLYLQHQLRESLGKDKDRMDWVWLVDNAQSVPTALLPGLKEAVVLRVPLDQLATWLPPQPGAAVPDHLYLVDPLGNLMMRFPPHLDPDGALKAKRDLDRLMRAAAAWDKPDR